MKWAFWRRRKPRVSGPGRTDARSGAGSEDDAAADGAAVRTDQAARMRVRMRRRLIGAAALLLGTAVVVPMMLDPAPRPLPDNIPIDIPSDRTPFSPRLSLPAEAPVPDAASTPAKASQGAAEMVDEPPASAPGAEAPGATTGKPSAARSTKEGPPSEARSAKEGWYVQAAALSSEAAARQLSERLSKAGLTPFVERTASGGNTLYRVRLGPFASREAAAKARRHLRSMSVESNVVRAEQADR